MNCHFFHYRIVLLQFQPVRSILFVLGCNIPRGSGFAGCLVFSTFQNDLNAVAFSFFCHGLSLLILYFFNITFFPGLFKAGCQPFFINGSHSGCRYFQGNPSVLLDKIKLAGKQIRVETPLNPPVGMGNMIPNHHRLSGYLTKSRHAL